MSVARAEADLTRLQAEIGRLRAQLGEAEERAAKIRHYIEVARLYEAGDDVVQVGTRSRGGAAATVANAARDMLREHGEPMQTRALVDALTKRGVALGSGNPVNYLSGVLSRADDFENDRLTGWHLAAWRTVSNPEPVRTSEAEADDEVPSEPNRAELSLGLAAE